METATITLDKKQSRPSYGGTRLEVIYIMKHVKNGRINLYRVTCEIGGLDYADVHLMVDDAEFIGDMETDSNDETLTSQAVCDLFEDQFC